ncbi:hypothetical protein Hanom_Chr03g00276231 [Helianthus anomalus]
MVWQFVISWCKVPSFVVFSLHDLLDLHSLATVSGMKKEALLLLLQLRFENKPVKLVNIFNEIKAFSFLWFSNRSKYKEVDWVCWCKFDEIQLVFFVLCPVLACFVAGVF